MSSAADITHIPGTRVMLEQPDEFVLSSQFAGVQHPSVNAAIMVNEVPVSYLEFSKQYENTALEKIHFQLISRERLDMDGLSGQLIVVSQMLKKQRYERWILLTGDTQESVMIAGYFPKNQAHRFRQKIKHSLTTAVWDSAQELDHFSGLGYRIDDVPGLRVAVRTGNSLIFTHNGKIPDRYYTGTLMIVSYQHQAVDMILNEAFCREQFNNIAVIQNHRIDNIYSDHLNGLKSIIVEGEGLHRHLRHRVAALQITVETKEGFLIAQGFTKFDHRKNDFDVFKTTIGSIRPNN